MAVSVPRRTKAYSPIKLYRVWLENGAEGSTLCVETISRERFGLDGRSGRFVRYDRGYQPLHEAADFHAFLRRHKASVSFIVCDGDYYKSKKTPALPFILTWEQPVSLY